MLACFAFALAVSSICMRRTVLADDEITYPIVENAESIAWLPLTPPSAPLQTKPWNILLYAAADFGEQAFKPAEPFAEYATPSKFTNVLILEDRYSRSENDVICSVQHTTSAMQITPLLDLGEAETDEPETLERFLRFAHEWFPAERTLLFLYGHGGAWRGACNDVSNGEDNLMGSLDNWLTPLEMETALASVGGIDALMFSAPCVMSSLETAYELRHVTDLYVASEEMSGYILWWTAVGRIAARLADNPQLSIDELGEVTIDAIRENIQQELDSDCWPSAISDLPNIAAFATPALENVTSALDALAISILALSAQDRRELAKKRCSIPQYNFGELADMPALAMACQQFPSLADDADQLIRAYQQALVGQVSSGSSPYFAAGGLSIFLPNPINMQPSRYRGAYLTSGLAFLEDTVWSAVIEAFREMTPLYR